MARIRTVKPEFWSSEQIINLSPLARLLFIGMWNFCDDAGIHPASTLTLKAEVFPADNVDVVPLIEEIMQQDLIIKYEVGGKRYWRVTGWHHQKIDRPTFKHPLPDGTIPASHDDVRRVFEEYSSRYRRPLTPGREGNSSLLERIVREGSGQEERGLGRGTKPPPPPPEGERSSSDDRDLFSSCSEEQAEQDGSVENVDDGEALFPESHIPARGNRREAGRS